MRKSERRRTLNPGPKKPRRRRLAPVPELDVAGLPPFGVGPRSALEVADLGGLKPKLGGLKPKRRSRKKKVKI
jgi:hypothetical protein